MTKKTIVEKEITCSTFRTWLNEQSVLVKDWMSSVGISPRNYNRLVDDPELYLRDHVTKEQLDELGEYYKKYQFNEWKKFNPTQKYTKEDQDVLDTELRNLIVEELGVTGNISIAEYMLRHKHKEVIDFMRTTDPNEIEEVKKLIWKPIGRGDFRRIVPELILTSDSVDIKKTDFWGESKFKSYSVNDKFIRHWNILRVLISSSRHDGTIGRQLRYLVRDKVTQKYLGIICISSAMMYLTDRNKELFGQDILTNKDTKQLFNDAFSKGGKSIHMAQGQTIMGLQPFSRSFNGTKLLALLCLSKQVQDDWETRYGDKLVTVETTSLYASVKDNSVYDGLQPFWRKLGDSTGETPIKPSNDLYRDMRRWLKKRFPQIYHNLTQEKNMKGMMAVRHPKNVTISRIYQLLHIQSSTNTKTGHTRGVYLSKLYKNSDLFLQGKITEDQLEPSFDNSIETLTEFWKFGFQGDSNKNQRLITKDKKLRDEQMNARLHPELQKLVSNQLRHKTKRSSAMDRIDQGVQKSKNEGSIYFIELDTDWYEPMAKMTLRQAKDRFLHKIAR